MNNFLQQNLEDVLRILKKKREILSKLRIKTVGDLLRFFPLRYHHISIKKNIRELKEGDNVSVYGKISQIQFKKTFRSKIPSTTAILTDIHGDKIEIIWFHQAFIAKKFQKEQNVRLYGRIQKQKNGKLSLVNPEIEKIKELPIDHHESIFSSQKENPLLFPVYKEKKGLKSRWIYHKIKKLISKKEFSTIEEILPEDILTRYSLPSLKTSFVWIHQPRSEKDAKSARKRFAFEEIFLIQILNEQRKRIFKSHNSYVIPRNKKEEKKFIESFPFEATKGQKESIETILNDLAKGEPMMRLLEGDVGSGKTFVASVVAQRVVNTKLIRNRKETKEKLQVAYMAPTEVLAVQLFENFIENFKKENIQIGLLTGSGGKKFPSKINKEKWTKISKRQLLKWVKEGQIDILIGTHALIQKKVEFKNLALVIVDEQHRFGTRQRMSLSKKEKRIPHYLSMTATPIPRTLALTLYGDLDISVLNELPKGRKKVKTQIVLPDEKSRKEIYEEIRKELKQGRQLYVICPRIENPDPENINALQVKSVKEEKENLKKIYPEYNIGILHSKMKKEEKEKVMNEFKNKHINILVSTSVVEVGVNIPNATRMIIEGAERFGLAQLHQLRGRIARSSYQAICYLFADSKTEKTKSRLEAFLKAENGSELAELDLQLRGPGDIYGEKQWGVSDLAMESLKNMKMVEFARKEAKKIIEKDPKLEQHPKIKSELKQKKLHFE